VPVSTNNSIAIRRHMLAPIGHATDLVAPLGVSSAEARRLEMLVQPAR